MFCCAELERKFNTSHDSMIKIIKYLNLPYEIKLSKNYKKIPYYSDIYKIEEFFNKYSTEKDRSAFFKLQTKLKKGYSIPMIAKECACDRCAIETVINLLNLHFDKGKQNFYTKDEKDLIIKTRNNNENTTCLDLIKHSRQLKINKVLTDYYNKGIELMRVSEVANFFGFNEDKFSKIVKENNCKIYKIENTDFMDLNEGELKIDLSEYIIIKNHSKGEDYVEKYLTKLGLMFYKEYRFQECKYKKKLPFDFYIPKLATCIEVDGKQHKSGKFDNKENKNFAIRDNIKNEYCENNNLYLIRMPWGYNGIYDYDDVVKYIDSEFSKLGFYE